MTSAGPDLRVLNELSDTPLRILRHRYLCVRHNLYHHPEAIDLNGEIVAPLVDQMIRCLPAALLWHAASSDDVDLDTPGKSEVEVMELPLVAQHISRIARMESVIPGVVNASMRSGLLMALIARALELRLIAPEHGLIEKHAEEEESADCWITVWRANGRRLIPAAHTLDDMAYTSLSHYPHELVSLVGIDDPDPVYLATWGQLVGDRPREDFSKGELVAVERWTMQEKLHQCEPDHDLGAALNLASSLALRKSKYCDVLVHVSMTQDAVYIGSDWNIVRFEEASILDTSVPAHTDEADGGSTCWDIGE